jgi:hypothetical protein
LQSAGEVGVGNLRQAKFGHAIVLLDGLSPRPESER